ncbi:MAG: hypothetical protein EOP00_09415 [Pedobacter sp.]|nr:MAG: hypothetical protein EOP00_09415 [Pedobacter sp.]
MNPFNYFRPLVQQVKYIYHLKKFGFESNEIIILSYDGIGDLYLKLILIEALKKTYQTDKVSIGYTKKSHKGVIDLFKDNIYKCYHIEHDLMNLFSSRSKLPRPGFPTHPFFIHHSMLKIVGFKGITFLEVIKILLNINLNEKINIPKIQDIYLKKAQEKFKEYNLHPNKTVFISPHAVFYGNIDEGFWHGLIESLIGLGFDIALMSDQIKSNFKEVKNVYFPLEIAIPFINQCSFFIAYRSGFCDLTSTSTTMKIIIYPEKNESYNDPILGFGFQNMGLVKENISEIYYDSNTQSTVIDEVKKHIN